VHGCQWSEAIGYVLRFEGGEVMGCNAIAILRGFAYGFIGHREVMR